MNATRGAAGNLLKGTGDSVAGVLGLWGELRLTTSQATAASGLLGVVADFKRLHPAVILRLYISEATFDLVERAIDIAVRAHERPLPDSTLVGRNLGFSRRVLVASPAYLQSRGAPRDAEDLERHTRLAYHLASLRGPRWRLTRTDGRTCVLDNSSQMAADDVPSLRLLALAGAGIAELPLGLCQVDLRHGALVRVLPEWHAGGSHISVLLPSRRGQSSSVRMFCDHLVQMLPAAMQLEPPDLTAS